MTPIEQAERIGKRRQTDIDIGIQGDLIDRQAVVRKMLSQQGK